MKSSAHKPQENETPVLLSRQYGLTILDSTLKTNEHGSQTLVGVHPVERFELPISTPFEQTATELRRLLDQVERFATGNRYATGFMTYETMVEAQGVRVRGHHPLLPKALFFGYERPTPSYRIPEIANKQSDVSFHEPFDRRTYFPKCQRVLELIREGEIYQGNLTARSTIASTRSPESVWQKMAQQNPVPYAAYLSLGDTIILSASPERLFQRIGNRVLSSPIKGTMRIQNGEPTQATAERLLHSTKNRSELLMIVDLVRNDLGKLAEIGTVRVDELYKTEPYAHLVHLVSNISATVRTSTTLADLFFALTPGGSITGTPKRRAIELLQEIETVPRGIYTGAIGYVSEQKTEFNIAIRTLLGHNGNYELHAGGGIVADSDPDAEFDELLLKASPLLSSLGVTAELINKMSAQS